jgi:VanZ family protein
MATTCWNPRSSISLQEPAATRRLALLKAWFPALLFAGVFVVESSRTFGSDHTSAPLHSLLHPILGGSMGPHWSLIHHLIRKTGHFLGYGIFSLICLRGFRLTLRNNRRQSFLLNQMLAIGATFLVAGADEFHQCFLPNRTGCFSDVLLDTAGAMAFLAVLAAIRLALKSIQGHTEDPIQDQSQGRSRLPIAA